METQPVDSFNVGRCLSLSLFSLVGAVKSHLLTQERQRTDDSILWNFKKVLEFGCMMYEADLHCR